MDFFLTPNKWKHRNLWLEKMGRKMPIAKKTGTTIAGVIFKVCFLFSPVGPKKI